MRPVLTEKAADRGPAPWNRRASVGASGDWTGAPSCNPIAPLDNPAAAAVRFFRAFTLNLSIPEERQVDAAAL
jgi:hypothetical protein